MKQNGYYIKHLAVCVNNGQVTRFEDLYYNDSNKSLGSKSEATIFDTIDSAKDAFAVSGFSDKIEAYCVALENSDGFVVWHNGGDGLPWHAGRFSKASDAMKRLQSLPQPENGWYEKVWIENENQDVIYKR